jgi:hypothetical protein
MFPTRRFAAEVRATESSKSAQSGGEALVSRLPKPMSKSPEPQPAVLVTRLPVEGSTGSDDQLGG